MENRISEIESIIGYKFKNKDLIELALTHSSFAKENNCESNERMEFLGDGILNFIVAEFLYVHRSVDEGVMSVKRSKIVSREPLSKEVERLGLMRFLRLGRLGNNTAVSSKFKSNVYEAVVASVYLDGGLDCAKDFILRTLIANIKKGQNEDYKSKLQIIVQEVGKKAVYKDSVISQVPPKFSCKVFVDNREIGSGEGTTKKMAQQQSAKNALEFISNNDKCLQKT